LGPIEHAKRRPSTASSADGYTVAFHEHAFVINYPAISGRRCRGIALGDGNYTGCAYGDGGMEPFTGPMDCPVCNGAGIERVESN